MSTPSSGVPRRYLVTGALGCIGAWVVRVLLDEGSSVVSLDAGGSEHRLAALVPEPPADRFTKVRGDIRDRDLLTSLLDDHDVESVIHLAALQVPACRDNPVLGAEVNVTGTVVVFESVLARREHMGPLVYASSVAAYGGDEDGGSELGGPARTLYGVYKRANEGTARVYWEDHQVASVGLRPYVVYGPGRDFGVTSEPTTAMMASAQGRPYHISYGGYSHMQYAEDVARNFIAAARSEHRGASVVNLAGSVVHVRDIVRAIEEAAPNAAGTITFDDTPLPFPERVDSSNEVFRAPEDIPLEEGVRRTIEHFRARVPAASGEGVV